MQTRAPMAVQWSNEQASRHLRLRRCDDVVWSEPLSSLTCADVDALVAFEADVLRRYGRLARLSFIEPARVLRTPRPVWDYAEAKLQGYERRVRCVALIIPGTSVAMQCLRALWARYAALQRLGERQRVFAEPDAALAWVDSWKAAPGAMSA